MSPDAYIGFAALAAVMLGGNYLLRRRRLRTPAHVRLEGEDLVLRPPRRNAVMLGITALIPAG